MVGGLGITEFVAGGLIALAAATLTTVGTYLVERKRWKREDELRLQRDRLQAYVGFLTNTHLQVSLPEDDPARYDATVLHQLAETVARVQLLASPQVQAAATELANAARLQAHSGETAGALRQRRERAVRSKTEPFKEAARKELGIPLTDVSALR